MGHHDSLVCEGLLCNCICPIGPLHWFVPIDAENLDSIDYLGGRGCPLLEWWELLDVLFDEFPRFLGGWVGLLGPGHTLWLLIGGSMEPIHLVTWVNVKLGVDRYSWLYQAIWAGGDTYLFHGSLEIRLGPGQFSLWPTLVDSDQRLLVVRDVLLRLVFLYETSEDGSSSSIICVQNLHAWHRVFVGVIDFRESGWRID